MGRKVAPTVHYIAVKLLSPMKGQPRVHFDETELEKLADSIKEVGVRRALDVIKVGRRYEITDGERRWRAAQMADCSEVPCIVWQETDEMARFVHAVVANRENVEHTPLEMAHAIDRMMGEGEMKAETVAKVLGFQVASVHNYRRLLTLHPSLQKLLEPSPAGNRRLTVMVARELTRVNRKTQPVALTALGGNWTLPNVRKVVAQLLKQGGTRAPGTRLRKRKPSDDYRVLFPWLLRTAKEARSMASMDIAAMFENRPDSASKAIGEQVGQIIAALEQVRRQSGAPKTARKKS